MEACSFASPTALPPDPQRRLVLGATLPLTPCSLRQRLNPAMAIEVCDGEDADRPDAIVAPYGERRPGWRSAPLWSEPLALYVRPGHAPEPADLADMTLVTCGAWTSAMLAALRVSPAHIHYGRDWRDVATLVAEGFGITIAGISAAEIFGPDVRALPIDGWLTYCVYWREGDDTPGLGRLLEHPHG